MKAASPRQFRIDSGVWPASGSRLRAIATKYAIPLSAGTICLFVYTLTLAPTVTSEDSGELIAAAHCFGVPHPPGYPLWTMLCGTFVKLFPFGSIAWRANLFSAVCAAAAISVLCRCVELLGASKSASLSAALAIGFGAVLWSQSVITEVYSLHALIFSLLLGSLILWSKTGKNHWLVVGAGLVGLGMSNHHTLGLSAAGLGLWVVMLKPRLLRNVRLAAVCLITFIVGLAPYSYLLVAARMDPPTNWGNPSTIGELWHHVDRKQYKRRPSSIQKPERSRSLAEYARQVSVIGAYCLREHTPYLASITCLGLVVIALGRGKLLLLVILVTAAHVGLFLKLHGIGDSRQSLWSSKVFFIAQYMLLGIPLALGLDQVATWLRLLVRRLGLAGRRWCDRSACYAVCLPVCVLPLFTHWQENNYRHYWYAYDHAMNMLKTALPNALIIPSGDHNTFPLIYVTQVEGIRPDVVIADKYGYIEPSLYTDMSGFEGRKPRSLDERNQIEEWIIRTARRPVYYTVKKDSLVANAEMVPAGVTYHLLPHTKSLDAGAAWADIRYRNLEGKLPAPRDHGADNILADYAFFAGLEDLRNGRGDEALQQFRLAAEYGRGVKEIANNIGCALAENGLHEEAISYYKQAATIDKRYASSRWNLARLYKNLGRWSEAEGVFLELATATPDDFRVFGELGFLGKRTDLPLELVKSRFEQSLRLNPAQRQIIQELARYYDSTSRVALANDAGNGTAATEAHPTTGPPAAEPVDVAGGSEGGDMRPIVPDPTGSEREPGHGRNGDSSAP